MSCLEKQKHGKIKGDIRNAREKFKALGNKAVISSVEGNVQVKMDSTGKGSAGLLTGTNCLFALLFVLHQ